MPAVLCPKCRFPLSHDESRCGTCPLCGAALEGVVAAQSAPAESPPPVDERVTGVPRSRSVAPFAWAAVVLAGLALGGGGLYYLLSAGIPFLLGGSEPPAAKVIAEPKKDDGAAAAPIATVEPAPQKVPEPPQPPEAPRPEPAAREPPAPPGPVEARREAPPEAPRETVRGNVRTIENPGGEYALEALNAGAQVRLRGKVKTLRIGPVKGESTLDASGLEVRQVILAGEINGGSTVKLEAQDGSVEFRGAVNGRSKVDVDAPGGKVTFLKAPGAGQAGAEIGGDSKITIRAKDVDFQCPIDGSETRVTVVLTRGGSLRFSEIGGRSRLLYRRAEHKDSEPLVVRGTIRGQAEVKKAE
ncbi:MAG: hypothetical protein IMZ44_07855 [Planctomycetes bacterium]|nr:hypothetical protein [Planctomycetota bacterium]